MKGRDIQTSNNGEFLLVAEFEKNIAAFEISTRKKLGEYSTNYSLGKRMCISNSGKLFAAAAFSRFGVSLYDVASGKVLWTNKGIKRSDPYSFLRMTATLLLSARNGRCIRYPWKMEA